MVNVLPYDKAKYHNMKESRSLSCLNPTAMKGRECSMLYKEKLATMQNFMNHRRRYSKDNNDETEKNVESRGNKYGWKGVAIVYANEIKDNIQKNMRDWRKRYHLH